MKCPASLSVFALFRGLSWVVVLWLSAIVDIPEYPALSEAIVKLTREGMGKIVNNPQSQVKVETNQFNF